jgi:hypothetical protein
MLDRWSRADVAVAVAAVDISAIVSAAVTAKAAAVFGFFVVIVVVVILRRAAKEGASCHRCGRTNLNYTSSSVLILPRKAARTQPHFK